MMVRERDRVDVPHPLAQELDPHLGRRVDQQVAARETTAGRWAACADSEDRSRCRPGSRSRSWERRWTFRSPERSAAASLPPLVRSIDSSSTLGIAYVAHLAELEPVHLEQSDRIFENDLEGTASPSEWVHRRAQLDGGSRLAAGDISKS